MREAIVAELADNFEKLNTLHDDEYIVTIGDSLTCGGDFRTQFKATPDTHDLAEALCAKYTLMYEGYKRVKILKAAEWHEKRIKIVKKYLKQSS